MNFNQESFSRELRKLRVYFQMTWNVEQCHWITKRQNIKGQWLNELKQKLCVWKIWKIDFSSLPAGSFPFATFSIKTKWKKAKISSYRPIFRFSTAPYPSSPHNHRDICLIYQLRYFQTPFFHCFVNIKSFCTSFFSQLYIFTFFIMKSWIFALNSI